MPILTIEQMIIALIDLNYTPKQISCMSVDFMYNVVYNQIQAA